MNTIKDIGSVLLFPDQIPSIRVPSAHTSKRVYFFASMWNAGLAMKAKENSVQHEQDLPGQAAHLTGGLPWKNNSADSSQRCRCLTQARCLRFIWSNSWLLKPAVQGQDSPWQAPGLQPHLFQPRRSCSAKSHLQSSSLVCCQWNQEYGHA